MPLPSLDASARLLGLRWGHGLTVDAVFRSWKALSLTTHPDKGGEAEAFKQLTSARDALTQALGQGPPGAAAAAVAVAAAAAAATAADAEEQQQRRERAERRVRAALATLSQKQQQEYPPDKGYRLTCASETYLLRDHSISCPVLRFETTTDGSSSKGGGGSSACPWRRVLTPTGHLCAAPDGREDHWGWCLPQALRALLQRFPPTAGHSLVCGSGGVAVAKHAGGTLRATSSIITVAQLAGGQWEAAVAALQLRPAPPSAPEQQPAAGAAAAEQLATGTRPAAERAAAILACFEQVFSREELLRACGRRAGEVGASVCRQLYSHALAQVCAHHRLQLPTGHAGGWPAAGLLALQAMGGCSQEALRSLASELVTQHLPVLAQHPQGLPAVLAPDERGSGSSSVICCCRGFGTSDGCLAAYAPGVSGGLAAGWGGAQ